MLDFDRIELTTSNTFQRNTSARCSPTRNAYPLRRQVGHGNLVSCHVINELGDAPPETAQNE